MLETSPALPEMEKAFWLLASPPQVCPSDAVPHRDRLARWKVSVPSGVPDTGVGVLVGVAVGVEVGVLVGVGVVVLVGVAVGVGVGVLVGVGVGVLVGVGVGVGEPVAYTSALEAVSPKTAL